MCRRTNELVASRERDLKSLRGQLEAQMEESGEVKRARDAALRENRRLQEDLATLTRENQAINNELNEALEEREAYKQQVWFFLTLFCCQIMTDCY